MPDEPEAPEDGPRVTIADTDTEQHFDDLKRIVLSELIVCLEVHKDNPQTERGRDTNATFITDYVIDYFEVRPRTHNR